jgi:flagellin
MSLSVLNNINASYAENNLNKTSSSLSTVLQQLSSGSKINSGADDAAGLSLVNGLQANQQALSQSVTNATEGVGVLQVADGALSQVTNLLNRAVTLATEVSNGTLNSTQDAAANEEYQSILSEVTNIGSTTTYNGQQVFKQTSDTTGSTGTFAIYTGDSTSKGASIDVLTFSNLDATSKPATGTTGTGTVGDSGGAIEYSAGANSIASITYTTTNNTSAGATNTGVVLAGTSLTATADGTSSAAQNAQTALTTLNSAITSVSAQDGYVGSQINTLNAISSVEANQQENIQSAQNAVQATDYATASSNLSKYEILSQTGISALAQANSVQQEVTKLLQ